MKTLEELSNEILDCSVAFELRRRGFDVGAFKDFSNDLKRTSTYSKIFKDVKVEYVDNVMNRKQNLQKTIDMISKYPSGSRGFINVDLARCGGVSAHAFSWEIIDNVLHFVDGQTGQEYPFGTTMVQIFNKVPLESVRFARLDNLDLDLFSEELKKLVH